MIDRLFVWCLCRIGWHGDIEWVGDTARFHAECLRCGHPSANKSKCFSITDDGRMLWLSCHGTSPIRAAIQIHRRTRSDVVDRTEGGENG